MYDGKMVIDGDGIHTGTSGGGAECTSALF